MGDCNIIFCIICYLLALMKGCILYSRGCKYSSSQLRAWDASPAFESTDEHLCPILSNKTDKLSIKFLHRFLFDYFMSINWRVETMFVSLGVTTMRNAQYSVQPSTLTLSAPLWPCQSVLAWASVRLQMRCCTPAWLRCRSSERGWGDEAQHSPRGSALAPHFDTESSFRLIYA